MAAAAMAVGGYVWLSADGGPVRARASTPPLPPFVTSLPVTAAQLPSIARGYAARMGDPTPTLIQHSPLTTRGSANAVMTGSTDSLAPAADAQPAYLIVVHGSFRQGPTPLHPNAAPHTYSVLSIVINPQTGLVTDGGLSNSAPDIGSLGPVVTDEPAG